MRTIETTRETPVSLFLIGRRQQAAAHNVCGNTQRVRQHTVSSHASRVLLPHDKMVQEVGRPETLSPLPQSGCGGLTSGPTQSPDGMLKHMPTVLAIVVATDLAVGETVI